MAEDRDQYQTDNTVIRVTDAYDLQLWSLVLGAPENDVLAAVNRVGNDATAVQAELERQRKAPIVE